MTSCFQGVISFIYTMYTFVSTGGPDGNEKKNWENIWWDKKLLYLCRSINH